MSGDYRDDQVEDIRNNVKNLNRLLKEAKGMNILCCVSMEESYPNGMKYPALNKINIKDIMMVM